MEEDRAIKNPERCSRIIKNTRSRNGEIRNDILPAVKFLNIIHCLQECFLGDFLCQTFIFGKCPDIERDNCRGFFFIFCNVSSVCDLII